MTSIEAKQIGNRIVGIIASENDLTGVQIFTRYVSRWGRINWGHILNHLDFLVSCQRILSHTDSQGFIHYRRLGK